MAMPSLWLGDILPPGKLVLYHEKLFIRYEEDKGAPFCWPQVANQVAGASLAQPLYFDCRSFGGAKLWPNRKDYQAVII